MLVLSRKPGESLLIDGRIRITVLGCGSRARIGIEAPADVQIVRSEIAFDFSPEILTGREAVSGPALSAPRLREVS